MTTNMPGKFSTHAQSLRRLYLRMLRNGWAGVAVATGAPILSGLLVVINIRYVVVRVYPWDGCSYDEEPCKFCNPRKDYTELDDESLEEMDIPF